ncbi:MAG: TMEM175 family protein [Clostridiales bacterium]|nr:TMEM175 family protein [Clostridiales bacterium]
MEPEKSTTSGSPVTETSEKAKKERSTRLTKSRLEAFSDGVIAIVITIMVLSIPLPPSFKGQDLLQFLLAIFIYFISFIVVGSFWSAHHRMFTYIEKVTTKIVWSNLFYLFFLSLIPILTKWVIENPGALLPAIGYDVIYVLVNLCYMLIFRMIISGNYNIKKIREKRREEVERAKREAPPGATWIRFVVMGGCAALIIAMSILIPAISTFFLLGLPVVFSLIFLFSDHDGGKHRHDQGPVAKK